MRAAIASTRARAAPASLLGTSPRWRSTIVNLRVVLHRAEHRHVRVVLDHRAQLGLVARAAELVEDHAGDADVRVEGLVAEDQRRDAARHAARVDHQHHRRAEHRRERGVAVAAVEVEPVVEALVALDQAERGALHALRELGAQLVRAAQVGIEVVARPPGGEPEPQRIDVVGALLEGLHASPRARSAAARPMHSVVLPEDLCAAEMKSRFMPRPARPAAQARAAGTAAA